MKKSLSVLPLCAALVAGCNHVKIPSPIRPSTVEQEAVSDPGPEGPPPSFPGNGPDLIAYVAAQYPERLAGGVSFDERVENMRFLRDRIIETGICGGMALGWNLKRGGPDKSNDFLAWHRGDGDMGVDIALDYDNTSAPLRLQWLEAGLGASFSDYPQPSCR